MARTSQPQIPSGIDWGNPITRGMSSLLTPMPYGMVNHNGGHDRTLDSGTLRGNGSEITRRFTGGTQAAFSNNPDYQLTGAMTVAVIADADTLTNYGALASCQTTASTNGWELRLGSISATNGVVCAIRANSATRTYYALPGTNIVAAGSKRNFISVTYPNGNIESVPTFNVNGVSYTGTSSGTGTGAAGASTGQLLIGKRVDGITKLDGAVYMVALWNRALSFDELEQIRENPWQLFKPVSRVRKSLASGVAIALAGNAQAIASASGALATSIPMAGSSIITATASGVLSTALPIDGVAAAVASSGGDMLLAISLSGAALSQASAAGDVTLQIAMQGNAIAQATASGAPTVSGGTSLAGSSQAQATASGSLSTSLPLSGAAQIVATSGGDMSVAVPLAGAAVAVATVLGNLAVTVNLSGDALAQAIAAGGMAIQVPLSGDAISHAIATATISGGSQATYATPDWRVIVIPSEIRVLFIGSEIRELNIPAENRVLYVREVQS